MSVLGNMSVPSLLLCSPMRCEGCEFPRRVPSWNRLWKDRSRRETVVLLQEKGKGVKGPAVSIIRKRANMQLCDDVTE